MKSFVGFFSLAVFSLLPFSPPGATAATAIEALRYSAAGSYSGELPLPQAPLLYNYAPARGSRNSLSGEQLFDYLHTATVPAPRKFEPSYKASKAFMYSRADNTGCDGGPGIITFYSQVCASGSSSKGEDYKEVTDRDGDGVIDTFINAEHIWPQSFFNDALPMVADLHHIVPSFYTSNERRANLKYAKVSKALYSTLSGSKLGREGFEPADAVKGNVARAIFYFIVRYSDRNIRQGMDYNDFWTRNVPMFLEWNRQDPPDDNERRRNDLIEGFQGNRNPFIDNPGLADQIGAGVFQAH